MESVGEGKDLSPQFHLHVLKWVQLVCSLYLTLTHTVVYHFHRLWALNSVSNQQQQTCKTHSHPYPILFHPTLSCLWWGSVMISWRYQSLMLVARRRTYLWPTYLQWTSVNFSESHWSLLKFTEVPQCGQVNQKIQKKFKKISYYLRFLNLVESCD